MKIDEESFRVNSSFVNTISKKAQTSRKCLPESLSVRVKTNDDASRIAVPVRRFPTLIHPSG